MTVQEGWPALRAPLGTPLPVLRSPWAPPSNMREHIAEMVRRRGRTYVDLALEQHLDYSPDDRNRLAALLSSSSRGPGYAAGAPEPSYELLTREKRDKPARAVLLAIHSDLEFGQRAALWRLNSFDGIKTLLGEKVDTSNASKLRAHGRLILHRLRCWPWVIPDDGRLPYGWNGEDALARFDQPRDEYVKALRAWARPLLADHATDLKFAHALLSA